MMKRIKALILSAVLIFTAFSFSGCHGSKGQIAFTVPDTDA